MTKYQELKNYIENLEISQGPLSGKKFKIMPFQDKFLRNFCRTDGDVSLSVGRGNGKSTLIAAICAACFDGPLAENRAEIVVVAASHSQGKIVFDHMISFLGEKVHRRRDYYLVNSNSDSYLKEKATGIQVRTIGSDSKRAHGLAPKLAIYDEVAQWPINAIKPMLAAVGTAQGKIEGSRAIWIGTRPESEDHPFAHALSGKNKSVRYSQVHAATEKDPPHHKRTWLKANPGLKYFPALEKKIKEESIAAKDNPELLPQFKALRLNMGVADHENKVGLLTPELYRDCEVKEGLITHPYILGIDLSLSWAMTSAAAVTINKDEYDRHVVDAVATWPGIPGLEERRRTDGGLADYRTMNARGELILQEGRRTVDVSIFLDECIERWGLPELIVADRYREGEIVDAAMKFSYSEEDGNLLLRGMGFKDGGEDVRRFHKMIHERTVALTENRLMRSAFAVARLISDPAGNQKIAKHTERGMKGRDDAAVAVVLAVAELDRMMEAGYEEEGDVPELIYSPEWDW